MEKVAEFICRRRLEAAAIMGLVTVKPLGFLGSQLLIFLEPFLVPFFNEVEYRKLVNILSKREGIEVFVQLLEKKSAEKKNTNLGQQSIVDEKDKKNTEDLFDCGGDSGSFGAPLDGIERALDL